MKYQICIKGRYCNPALLKNRNQQAQAQASVGIKIQAKPTSEQARMNKMEWENKKPFIEIKINGSDLYELNIVDLKNAQDEIQKYIDELENESEE